MKINKEAYFKKITGYKITNSHFELGSNLHISDYYYTKRLFYNSFYTNRFAFLITRYIVQEFRELIIQNNNLPLSSVKEKTITLLGYENYSELLVSNVRKMLNDYLKLLNFNNVCFNHEIFTKEGLFLKNPDNIGKNVVSIFPISTTFSTSVKIRNEIREILSKDRFGHENIIFHNPIINCLIITNGTLQSSNNLGDDSIESEFGWASISKSNKLIEMKNLDNPSEQIFQKYFIDLPTIWQKINECSSCFPIIKAEEKCLFETKTDPVTPNLIFNYPKAVLKEKELNLYDLFKPDDSLAESIVYRKHFVKHNNNFIYYLRAGIFLKKNKELIELWLKQKKEDYHFLNDKNIVIITPSRGSNSGFINMVNDLMFSETATIIQYNPAEDYLYNFKTFYTSILELADYIIFVDDILFSTNTYSEINFYVKNITRKKNFSGIDLCLVLINRSGYYNNKKIHEQTDNINFKVLSFTSINVAPILHRKTYPYIKLTEKFKDLSSKSVLDEMRMHFKVKEDDFKPIDLTRSIQNLSDFGSSKALFQFIILNEFNKIFYYDSLTNKYSKDLFISSIFENGDKKSIHYLIEEINESKSVKKFLLDYPEYKHEIKNCIYKICSTEPFIQFKNIRQVVFTWILTDLKKLVDQILQTEKIEEDFFSAFKDDKPAKYSSYHEFKFLLKRGTKLKMNYIYSIEVLTAIEKVLSGIKGFKNIQYYKLIADPSTHNSLFDEKMDSASKLILIKDEKKQIFEHQFIIYYIGLLQELIVDHESKALQTVINVKEIIDGQIAFFSMNLKNNYDSGYINLLRMLVLENTFIFESSSEKFLKKYNLRISLYQLSNPSAISSFKQKLMDFSKNYSFEYTAKMLSRIEKNHNGLKSFTDDPPMFESFSNMLLLKSALMTDKSDNGSSTDTIKQKIETILLYCSNILNIENGGAFFAVKYKNKSSEGTEEDDVAIVGDYYSQSDNFLKTSDINSKSVLYKVFNGIRERNSDKSLSSFELSLNTEGQYIYIDNEVINAHNVHDLFEIEDHNFRNYFYLRISQVKKYKSKKFIAVPIAVLCFYDNIPFSYESKFTRFDPKRVRQLLLLRNDLTAFINQQLNNDSLRAYIEQQNQTIINKAITHSFDTYVNQYKKAVNEISQIHLRDKFEILGTLILNKHLLLKFIAEYLKTGDLKRTLIELSLFEINLSGADFKNIIKVYADLIFTMQLNNHSRIDSDNVKILIDIHDDKILNFYDFFYRELVFEIFYNIRKSYNAYVDTNRKLEIDITIREINEKPFLSVKNNLYNLLSKNKKTKIQLENSMYNRKEKKGISLINTISETLYSERCMLILMEDSFEIQIPIKTVIK